MNSFEINKIIAAILFTVLIIYGIGKISDIVFDVNKFYQRAEIKESSYSKGLYIKGPLDYLSITKQLERMSD